DARDRGGRTSDGLPETLAAQGCAARSPRDGLPACLGKAVRGAAAAPATLKDKVRCDRTLAQLERKPMRAWVPSQKGLVLLPPQRQSFACVTRATTRPVPLVISRLPRTRRGPSTSGSIARGPSRCASMAASPVGGSPLAANFTS